MTAALDPDAVRRFRAAVARRLGLACDQDRDGLLIDVLRRRVRESGEPVDVYLARLETSPARDDLASLAADLTVGETHFFRYPDQLRVFSDVVLGDRLQARSGTGGAVRVLSAGCASGEEAYTLALGVREAGVAPSRVPILAVDVNPGLLARARRGWYSNWSLRETPDAIRARWFRPDGRGMTLVHEVRHAVRFEERNLAAPEPDLWRDSRFDVVFCRNALMYFTPARARALVARIAAALVPGGCLFLGHAETLRGLSDEFRLRQAHGAFYYQREHRRTAWSPGRAADADPVATATDGAPDLAAGAASIVTEIQRARDRVETLARSALWRRETSSRAPAARDDMWDGARTFDLLRRERYAEALAVLRSAPADDAADARRLMLEAVLLTHEGELAEAAEICRRLLLLDRERAGAHYVLALCREGLRDDVCAIDHARLAARLDPTFAMPHLHLGLLARRSRNFVMARRELTRAIGLFQREDASRVLLFGGGFSREALMAVCRAGLAACGTRP